MIRKSQILLLIGGIILLVQSCTTNTQNDGPVSSVMEKDERMAWWREAKFGLFIHWGVYAGFRPGNMAITPVMVNGSCTGPGSHLPNTKNTQKQFNPVKYDPAGLGGGGEGSRNALHRNHFQAPRWFCPLSF